MPASDFRYTGANATIFFGGVVISTDYTKFSYKESAQTKEKTAGNEQRQSFNVTTIKGEWDIEIWDTAEANADLMTRLRAGKRDILAIYPKGNVQGKPFYSFYAIIENLEKPLENDNNVSIKASGLQDGDFINDIGSYTAGT